jgi:hypothetical protein
MHDEVMFNNSGPITALRNQQMCAAFWWEDPRQRDHSEDGGEDEGMGSEWILERPAGSVWSGFSWLRIGTGAWFL